MTPEPRPQGSPDAASGVAEQRPTAPLSGALIGFVILALLVTFVAVWMQVHGRRVLSGEEPVPIAAASARIDGFLADFWQLPDEPLLGFQQIPGGEFLMGSDPALDRQAYDNERWSAARRQGTVVLPTFYLARYEVTVAQYAAFVTDTGRAYLPQTFSAAPDHPVSNVSWTDALAYGRWLQAQLLESGRTPAGLLELLNSGWNLTLPSEAQWEKAARGSGGDIYPWGNRLLDGRANFGATATRPVGSFDCPECRYGLADMSGNVWELTRSPFQAYPYSAADDRETLDRDALWVMRGGSYAEGPANVRAAVRGGVDPGVRNDTIGFRLALTPPQ